MIGPWGRPYSFIIISFEIEYETLPGRGTGNLRYKKRLSVDVTDNNLPLEVGINFLLLSFRTLLRSINAALYVSVYFPMTKVELSFAKKFCAL